MNKKTVLITGASRGIGVAIAALYRDKGWSVIAPSRAELDLSDQSSIDSYVKSLRQAPDVLINNAGINDIAEIESLTQENIDTTIQINLKAQINLIKAFVPSMKENKWGRIVNISSVWGEFSKAGRIIYSVSKAGVNGLTVSTAVELGPYNILVNSVAPGFINTELTQKNNTQEEIEKIASGLPLKRLAAPEEVAQAVYWLGSAKNTFITGQIIYVDGGFSCV